VPVTIEPAPEKVGHNNDGVVTSERDLFHGLVRKWDKDVRFTSSSKTVSKLNLPILHSSFKKFGTRSEDCIIPYGNGFVDGIIRAFQQDLHLVLRPDDVWLAIMTQFNFYVKSHAEELRNKFVNHKGKEELEVINWDPFWSWDVGVMSGKMI
jgi:hypothetical protein